SLKLEKRVCEGMILPLYKPGNTLEILEATFVERLKSFPIYDKQHGCPMNNFINEIGDLEIAYQMALRSIIEEWKTALINLIDRGKIEKTIDDNISSTAVAVYLISAFEGIRGIRKLYDNDAILDEYITGLSLYLKQIKL
ncbi:MAG: TetR family transcriptional regulator C-terminal domain-containing protein, partial [Oceanihabitans sp.]|nr:TetR family transcriptional regulator C-terminal domain-containing protein [Oceanihabitans sp.]